MNDPKLAKFANELFTSRQKPKWKPRSVSKADDPLRKYVREIFGTTNNTNKENKP